MTQNNSERPVDALDVKTVNHSLTDNLKSRDASASKNTIKAGGSTAFEQNVDWTGWVSGYPLDCYDY